MYTPHTALDSVWGGINDWLGEGVGHPPEKRTQFTEKAYNIALIGEEAPDGRGGIGRMVTLPEPVSIKEIERRIKVHLGLEHSECCYLGREVSLVPNIVVRSPSRLPVW